MHLNSTTSNISDELDHTLPFPQVCCPELLEKEQYANVVNTGGGAGEEEDLGS